MWSAVVCGLTHHRWKKELVNRNWLCNNYELDYKKITKYTDITDFINLRKVLCKIQYNTSRKSHTKHITLRGSGGKGRGELLDTELTDCTQYYLTYVIGIHTTQNLVL
jgi:hypothetical protein